MHPWFYARVMGWPRGWDRARVARHAGGVAVLAGVLGASAVALRALPVGQQQALWERAQAYPLQIATLAGFVTVLLLRRTLVNGAEQMRLGPWAALPLAPWRAPASLALLAAAVTMILLIATAALSYGLARLGGDAQAGRALVQPLAAGLLAGAMFSWLGALRYLRRAQVTVNTEGHREPLLPFARWDDARMPHLWDWQRREVTLRWRKGGGSGLIAAALLAQPANGSLFAGAGLLILVAGAGWCLVACTGAAHVLQQARGVLRALPVDERTLFAVARRYPVWAVSWASGLALAGGLLMQSLWGALQIALLIVLLGSGTTLWRWLKLAREMR